VKSEKVLFMEVNLILLIGIVLRTRQGTFGILFLVGFVFWLNIVEVLKFYLRIFEIDKKKGLELNFKCFVSYWIS
jgi:hypothetical protein